MRHPYLLPLLPVLAGLAAAAPAPAANYAPSAPCTAAQGCLLVQQALPDVHPPVADSDGVVTSWTVNGTGSFAIAIVDHTGTGGDDTIRRTAETSPWETSSTFQPGGSYTLSPGLPIKKGQYVALVEADGDRVDYRGSYPGADVDAYVTPAPGATATPFHADDAAAYAYSAHGEPDADHDGYGDLSQDGCPTDASTHGPCPAPAAPAPAPPVAPAPPAPPADTTPPAWTRAPRLASTAFAASRGTTLRFTLSEPARVTALVERVAGHGHAKPLGTVVRNAKAGATSIRIRRSVAGHRLARGRYEVVVRATDAAGNRAKARTLRFRVR